MYKVVMGLTYLICAYLALSHLKGIWFRAQGGFWQENFNLLIGYNSISIVSILLCLAGIWGFYKRKSWGLISIISISLLLIFSHLGMPVYGYYLARTEYRVELSLLELINSENVLFSLLALITIVGWSFPSIRSAYFSEK